MRTKEGKDLEVREKVTGGKKRTGGIETQVRPIFPKGDCKEPQNLVRKETFYFRGEKEGSDLLVA